MKEEESESLIYTRKHVFEENLLAQDNSVKTLNEIT